VDATTLPAGSQLDRGILVRLLDAARLAARDPGIARLILVAPPVRTSSFDSMHECRTPKLVIQGTADVVCPIELLESEFPQWRSPAARAGRRRLALLRPPARDLAETLTAALQEERWL